MAKSLLSQITQPRTFYHSSFKNQPFYTEHLFNINQTTSFYKFSILFQRFILNPKNGSQIKAYRAGNQSEWKYSRLFSIENGD